MDVSKAGNGERLNAADKLLTEQWKSQEDYKRMIVALEIQNEKYRNQLYELGETVNKILDKTKLPQSSKLTPPNMEQQLELVRKELHNVNQFIQIYQKQLSSLGGKKKADQIQSIAMTEDLIKSKTEELSLLKKEVKELTHKNKAMEYKLLDFNKKNRAKSFDQQALQLKELINQNKNLKAKLQDLENLQQKKQTWLKNNIQSAKNLELKIQSQEAKLPKIQLKPRSEQRSSATSLPKLQNQKKIYTKWLQTNREKSNSKLQKELIDLEKINKMVQDKIKHTSNEIKEIQDQIHKVKEKVETNEAATLINEPVEDTTPKKKDIGCNVSKRVRKSRRDWVGKFDSLRFSDSRVVRQEARVFKVMYNSAGYFQFHYYSMKDNKKKLVGKLPFDVTSLPNGKQSTFTVQAPDFIKNIRLKINLKSQRIIELHLISNLGLQGEFLCDPPAPVPGKTDKKENQKDVKPTTSAKQEQIQVNYEMDVKGNEAICGIFGSYGFKADQKKNITSVWLQGIGVELIEDFVEELI